MLLLREDSVEKKDICMEKIGELAGFFSRVHSLSQLQVHHRIDGLGGPWAIFLRVVGKESLSQKLRKL